MQDLRGTDDEVLVRRAGEGDEQAFRVLLERHSAPARRVAARRLSPLLRRKVSVQDVLQEARVVAWNRVSEFEYRGPKSFASWLSRIVDLKCREVVERYVDTAKRRVGNEVSRDARPATGEYRGALPTPSQAAMAGEAKVRLRHAIAGLQEDYREVILLLRERHLSVEEAARRLNRSPNAVKKLYGRALVRLAEALREEEGEGT